MTIEDKIYVDLMLHTNSLRRFITNYKIYNHIDDSFNDVEILKEITCLSTAFMWVETIEGQEYWYVIGKTSSLLTEAIVKKSKRTYKNNIKEIEELLSLYKKFTIDNKLLDILLKQIQRYLEHRLKNIIDEKTLKLKI